MIKWIWLRKARGRQICLCGHRTHERKRQSESYSHMTRQFLCLLLVSLMLANQGLCLAHVHHETDFAEPDGHGARPHFHSSGPGQHESTHDQKHRGDHSSPDRWSNEHDVALPPVITPEGNHDADAVYGAEAVAIAPDANSVIVPSVSYTAVAANLRVTDQSDDWLLRLSSLRGQPPSVSDAAYPIYLRTLSLRI